MFSTCQNNKWCAGSLMEKKLHLIFDLIQTSILSVSLQQVPFN